MAALDLSEPFTTAQARAAGIGRGLLRGPRFQKLFHGVFVDSRTPITTELRARAALAIHPRPAILSHSTAASLLKVPVPHDPDLHVTVPIAAHRRGRSGIQSHVSSHRAAWEVGGLPTTGHADLICELADLLSVTDLVVAGDSIAKASNAEMLRTGLAEHRCVASATARRAADQVRDAVESPMETRARLLLVFAGFPEPLINQQLQRPSGHFRPDLCWPDLRLAVEYDGQQHRSDLTQWDHDIRRREWFQSQGWRVVTLVARDIFQRPEEAIHRIHAAWRECGGPPLVLRTEWRRHFPGTYAA